MLTPTTGIARSDTEVGLLEAPDEVDRHLDEWRALAVRDGSPYLTPDWLEAWIAHNPERPLAIVARHDGRLCGVLPLVVRTRGVITTIRFPGDDLGDGFRPLAREPLGREMVAYLAGREIARAGLRFDGICLVNCDAADRWPERLVAGLEANCGVLAREDHVHAPLIRLDGRSWDDYLGEVLSRNARKETRRRLRWLDETASVDLSQASARRARSATDTLFRLHDLRWRERGGSDLCAPSERAALCSFNEAAARRGWLRLWTLSIDDEPAASELAWRLGDRQTHFQGGFDPRWAKLGVGAAALTTALRDAADDEAEMIDLGRGLSDYKKRYMTGSRALSTIVIGPRRGRLRALLAAEEAARRVWRAMPDGVCRRLRRAASSSSPDRRHH